MRSTDTNLDTHLAQAGTSPDAETGALAPPLHRATTFERAPDGSYPNDYVYARQGTPTVRRLETTLAELEGGPACAAFASGMAAAHAALQGLPFGGHVILPDDVYYGVRELLDTVLDEHLHYDAVDLTDLDALDAALRPETALVWAETPSNPLLKITDLAAVADLAHEAGARLLVDGTWTTPVLQRPFEYGADLVLHSVTKYLSGHSDVLGGALLPRTDDEHFERVRSFQQTAGPVMDPAAAWLALRGLRTLGVRLERQCENARRVARFLAEHERVERVCYPGLPEHDDHAIAERQMSDFGGMLSLLVKGGEDAAMSVAARAEVFTRATSLGGTESLIEHRASIETPPTATPDHLLRLSMGLEDADDLIEDLRQALSD